MMAEGLEPIAAPGRSGKLGRDQHLAAQRLAQGFNARRLVDGRPDHREIEAVGGTDIAVQYFPDMQREIDLALHTGEVLYGNVGAADRLDFTVIGPAVNEAARIETLCEPLGRKVLVSAEFAAAAGNCNGLQPLGHHRLRGVREPRAIYGLDI